MNYPDGGYGWAVVFACSLASFIIFSNIQCFGLVLTEIFSEMRLSATQGSLILTVSVSFGQIVGPLFGPLLVKLGFRKVGFIGAFVASLGMVLTSVSNNFVSVLVCYGILISLGEHMFRSSHTIAINSYFKKRRSLVTGITMTVGGLAAIVVPHILRFLLREYSTKQVVLIYAGTFVHLFISASLLRPIEELGTVEEKRKLREGKRPKLFDLDLLKDPIFYNILIGMGLIGFVELNFTILLPFILKDLDLDTDQIAYFLSTLGAFDLISRFLSPHVGNYFAKSSRFMLTSAIFVLCILKFVFVYVNNFHFLLVIASGFGIVKGTRKIYQWLVIPDYVPLEKLPTAAGLEMLTSGCFTLLAGPILGVLRDATGSYASCIFVMNSLTMIAIFLWAIEYFVVFFKRERPI